MMKSRREWVKSDINYKTGAHMAPAGSKGSWGSWAQACITASLLTCMFATTPVKAADSGDAPACQTVRLSDVGWTDVTATTATFSALLRHIGYQPQVTVLSVPVTFASMKNKDIDIFLGNWMPTQEGDIHNYVADGSVTTVAPNLTGAKYTLAVPTYTWQ